MSLRDGGWFGLEAKEKFSGQQIPVTLSAAVNEIWHSSNMSLALCHLLTQGLIYTLQKSASEDQKALYTKISIRSLDRNNDLTEPQSGTDLSTIKTKAIKENGHYKFMDKKFILPMENMIYLRILFIWF